MSQQIALNWPSSLQTPEEQLAAIQQAFQKIQQASNANATAPMVVVHVPSFLSTTQTSATGAFKDIPGFAWRINSQGGLVIIEANISGSYQDGNGATIQLVIDGTPKLLNSALVGMSSGSSNVRAGTASMVWKAVLGVGQHSISFQVTGINTTINGTSRGSGNSSASILEFPQNVSSPGN